MTDTAHANDVAKATDAVYTVEPAFKVCLGNGISVPQIEKILKWGLYEI
jgi:hypothetical protein